jgi:hypothetical protein
MLTSFSLAILSSRHSSVVPATAPATAPAAPASPAAPAPAPK